MVGLGLTVLRLALAVAFFAHGAHLLFGLWTAPGIGAGGVQVAAARFAALGLHPESAIAVAVGLAELVGGLFVGLGFLTRWASLVLVADVALAIWKEQLRWGFFLNWTGAPNQGHGIEHSLVLGGALLCLVLAGGGDWSVDGLRARSAASQAAGRARLRGKV